MAKRYGAGSVYPVTRIVGGKPMTKHVGAWELPPENGRRRRRTVTADSEAEAWRQMRAAQRTEGRSNSGSRPSTESVGHYLDRWLRDVVSRTRRERTLVGYRAIVANVDVAVGAADLHDPELPHALQAWLNSLERHPRTVHHYAACLRSAFAYAVRKGLMDRNPAADLDLPAVPRTDRIPLDAAELRAFLDAVADPWRPLWVTACWTGMRQGELLGLRWEDVSLDRASIQVRRAMVRLPGKARPSGKRPPARYVLAEPKTDRSRRQVPLLPEVVDVLRPLRKAYLASPPELDQGLVFATPSGSPLPPSTVTRRFWAALDATNTRRVRFHDLRHGAASLLIERGVDLATVSAILGHSTISTTVDLYGHLTETHKAAAMARLVG